ncbi:MAG: phytoene desaturase [Gemmatimonadetes bacterium]|nr:phytoene desaturase [Gemmatimonadota bacterium]
MKSLENRRIVVIGAGFAGLSAAALLARAGAQVTLVEKNSRAGGRARVWSSGGFRYDMGPSWYWMPDVFEDFFAEFGRRPDDYYTLERLDPSYRVVFSADEHLDLPAGEEALIDLFERVEPGAGTRLRSFLDDAAYKYARGMGDFVHKPGLSLMEFADPRLAWALVRLQMLQSFRKHVRRHFRDPRLRQVVEFPVLFLGATASRTPALFSMMNHADMALGTWYPQGGMGSVVDAFVGLATELGVEIRTGAPVDRIEVRDGRAVGVHIGDEVLPADVVLAAADYHHVETRLLDPEYRQYTDAYWSSRTLSPSSLLFYLGVEGRVDGLEHHTLFFDEPLDRHADAIYTRPRWPDRPLFYVSATSRTDPSVAPTDHENLTILVPLAPHLDDPDAERDRIYDIVMGRLERWTGAPLRSRLVVVRRYGSRDFRDDYHALGGNAYGLANTLRQTAILRPRLRSKKVRGLYYAGQLTVPGPGVPPALISGRVAARQIEMDLGA